jgi:hypothetical protein
MLQDQSGLVMAPSTTSGLLCKGCTTSPKSILYNDKYVIIVGIQIHLICSHCIVIQQDLLFSVQLALFSRENV